MNIISENLLAIGCDQALLTHVQPEDLEHFEIAKVAAVHKDSYIVTNGKNYPPPQ
jgi:hypothetical protein